MRIINLLLANLMKILAAYLMIKAIYLLFGAQHMQACFNMMFALFLLAAEQIKDLRNELIARIEELEGKKKDEQS